MVYGDAGTDAMKNLLPRKDVEERAGVTLPVVSLVGERGDDADRFLLHVRSLVSLMSYARAGGLSEAEITAELAAVGLEDVRSASFEGFMSLNRFGVLMRRIGERLCDDAVGLSVAEHVEPGSLGVFGKAVITAPTLEVALEVLCRYMRLYADVSFAGTMISDERVEFNWAYSPLILARDCMCDRAARLFIVRMRDLFGEDWTPLEVHLQRPRPADLRRYRSTLCRSVHFDAASNRIIFRRSDLDRPNMHADPYTHDLAVALAERMLAERRIPDDLIIRTREDILHHLADEGTNIHETARRLGLSPRSLQRRLDDLGLTYQRLCEEVRIALAKELLAQTTLPMSEIAYRLGFSNQANLARASRRWFGKSPRQVRQLHKQR
jgi:AraC-like DNA-binding protein